MPPEELRWRHFGLATHPEFTPLCLKRIAMYLQMRINMTNGVFLGGGLSIYLYAHRYNTSSTHTKRKTQTTHRAHESTGEPKQSPREPRAAHASPG